MARETRHWTRRARDGGARLRHSRPARPRRAVAAAACLAGLTALLSACRPAGQEAYAGEVVVYTALDRQFSEPILRRFTKQTGIAVRAVYDTESTKTIGLVNRIRAEAARPRCDVFWNNEVLNTLRLMNEGLLQPCRPPQADNYPPQYRDPAGYWHGFAARARVILVNRDQVAESERPRSIADLAEPRWRGRAGIAKPLFGTTASHVACLFAKLGPERAKALLRSLKANDIRIVAGNKTCAQMVAAGELALGLTDTDDAIAEVEAGRPVELVFPDAADHLGAQDAAAASESDGPTSRESPMGTLVLPNTLALLRDAPNARQAQQLIDYLLSAEVEARLARGPSAQIPLNRNAPVRSRVGNLADLRPMSLDFADAARQFEAAFEFLEQEMLR